MDPLPQPWPPRPVDLATSTPVPVFPLPGVFLFPGQLMPLHVFEPRFRQMIDDSLDTSGRIVIGTVLARHRGELAGAPPLLEIAGIGEIARHERMEDGRYLLWLCGLGRVRIEEAPSDRLYRRVRIQPLADVAPTRDEDDALRPSVLEAIQRRTGTDLGEHDRAALGALADVLAQCITVPEAVMVGLHSESDVAERARKAIAADRRFPATNS
jgi:Lon protease-like protein